MTGLAWLALARWLWIGWAGYSRLTNDNNHETTHRERMKTLEPSAGRVRVGIAIFVFSASCLLCMVQGLNGDGAIVFLRECAGA